MPKENLKCKNGFLMRKNHFSSAYLIVLVNIFYKTKSRNQYEENSKRLIGTRVLNAFYRNFKRILNETVTLSKVLCVTKFVKKNKLLKYHNYHASYN